ncbi:MAG: hypothetical protein WHU94_04575 [Thermogemmata sp.]
MQGFFKMPGLMIGMAFGVLAMHSVWHWACENSERAEPPETITFCLPRRTQPGLDWGQIQEQRQHLERTRVRLHLSCQALDHITVRLVVGEITLRQAVEMADPILRRRQGFFTSVAWQYKLLSHEQIIARFLIQRAEMMYAAVDPSFWHPVAQRLEREYAALE